jgi:hypothetical protein
MSLRATKGSEAPASPWRMQLLQSMGRGGARNGKPDFFRNLLVFVLVRLLFTQTLVCGYLYFQAEQLQQFLFIWAPTHPSSPNLSLLPVIREGEDKERTRRGG